MIFPAGRRKFELGLDELLAEHGGTVSPRIRQLAADLRDEWRTLDTRIEALNGEFVDLVRCDDAARRLTSIPGVGVLNASALVAAVGNASGFDKARDFGAWLGLIPRQHTTGGKPRLLGISKRGNTYLRTLLIHGARAAAVALGSRYAVGKMVEGDARARRSPQRGCRSAGQQAGADRLGNLTQRHHLRAQLPRRGVIKSATR